MRQEAIELIAALKGHTLPKGAENAYNRLCKAIEQASSVSSIQSDKTSDAEKQEPVIGTKTWYEDGKVITQNLYPSDVYKQEKQEPFAYLDPGLGAFYWAREYPDGPPPGFEPVYLAGSNKRWVGLTDEDLSVCDEDGVTLARYWEAKLKEKNT